MHVNVGFPLTDVWTERTLQLEGITLSLIQSSNLDNTQGEAEKDRWTKKNAFKGV